MNIIGYISGTCSLSGTLSAAGGGSSDPYTGEYTVIPSEEQQTLATTGKRMLEDVVVEPIPDNYGRIAWNGSTLMVY